MIINYPLTLFYDAACPLCSLEMDHLKARCGSDGLLRFVDISAPGFDASCHGATMAALDAEIHGMRPDGSLLRGMPVLRLAYEAAGIGWFMRPTGWAPLRPAFDLAYRFFARYRRPISGAVAPFIGWLRERRARRTAARLQTCAGGA